MENLLATDSAFSALSVAKGRNTAFLFYGAQDVRLFGTGSEPPIYGQAAVERFAKRNDAGPRAELDPACLAVEGRQRGRPMDGRSGYGNVDPVATKYRRLRRIHGAARKPFESVWLYRSRAGLGVPRRAGPDVLLLQNFRHCGVVTTCQAS